MIRVESRGDLITEDGDDIDYFEHMDNMNGAMVFRLLIALMGDQVGAYMDATEVPEGFGVMVGEADTPTLRAMMACLAGEMDRRQHAG